MLCFAIFLRHKTVHVGRQEIKLLDDFQSGPSLSEEAVRSAPEQQSILEDESADESDSNIEIKAEIHIESPTDNSSKAEPKGDSTLTPNVEINIEKNKPVSSSGNPITNSNSLGEKEFNQQSNSVH